MCWVEFCLVITVVLIWVAVEIGVLHVVTAGALDT